MNTLKPLFLYGLLIWLVPFILGLILFPIRNSDRPFFESIMPVALGLSVVVALIQYQKKTPLTNLRDGILIGLLWFGMSVVIDLLFFSWGPMKMAFGDYWKDIGFTYLLIPIITVGIAAGKTSPEVKSMTEVHR